VNRIRDLEKCQRKVATACNCFSSFIEYRNSGGGFVDVNRGLHRVMVMVVVVGGGRSVPQFVAKNIEGVGRRGDGGRSVGRSVDARIGRVSTTNFWWLFC